MSIRRLTIFYTNTMDSKLSGPHKPKISHFFRLIVKGYAVDEGAGPDWSERDR